MVDKSWQIISMNLKLLWFIYRSYDISQLTLTIYPEQIHNNVRGPRSTRCTSSLQGSPVTTATDDADANVPNKGVASCRKKLDRRKVVMQYGEYSTKILVPGVTWMGKNLKASSRPPEQRQSTTNYSATVFRIYDSDGLISMVNLHTTQGTIKIN